MIDAAISIYWVFFKKPTAKTLKEKPHPPSLWRTLIILYTREFHYPLYSHKSTIFINGFIFGIILISMGHANSFHLQETVIRNCFHPRKWYYIRGPIYSFSGFLILLYCIIFHILHAYLSFVTFTNIFVLFNLCAILIWLLTNYEMVIYVCSKY
jgi:hypothetical protein